MILLCARHIANTNIKFFKSIIKIEMNIVVMNLTCASFPVCHCPCSRAEGRFLVPYSFSVIFLP